MDGRAGQLEDDGVGPVGTPLRLGHVRVVHVPGQHEHRRRGVRPRTDLGDQVRQRREGRREGRPVLQVGAPSQLLPEAGPAGALVAPAQRRVPRLGVVHQVRQQPRQGGADQQVVVGLRRVQRLLAHPLGLARIEHRAVLLVEDAGRPAVHHHQPDPAEVAPVAPAHRSGVGVGPGGEGTQRVGAVGRGAYGRVQRVGGQFGRGQVAEVLVHPVRHQAAQQPLLPPAGGPHVLQPGGGGVPVVDDVVVVEDHAAGHGGQQPAHLGVEPGLVVEVGVLLVVRVYKRQLPGRRGGLVGVDLVAQQQEGVRPLALRGGGDPGRQRVQGVRADRVVLVGGGRGPAAGAEGDTDVRVLGRGADDGRREGRVGQRPHPRAVEEHLVRLRGPRREAGHRHEGVVVSLDLERVCLAPCAVPVYVYKRQTHTVADEPSAYLSSGPRRSPGT